LDTDKVSNAERKAAWQIQDNKVKKTNKTAKVAKSNASNRVLSIIINLELARKLQSLHSAQLWFDDYFASRRESLS
jgi:hypothetical protein